VDQTLIHDGHWVARLLEKENGASRVDFVWSADRLLDQREIAAG
jgi:hypothetical protein